MDEDYYRLKAALELIRFALAFSILACISAIIGLIKSIKNDRHWWWFVLVAWSAMLIGEFFMHQAKKVKNHA